MINSNSSSGVTRSGQQFCSWDKLTVVQLTAFLVVGCYAVYVQRYLFADGSYFFLSLLQTRKVLDFYPARYFAHWLTQTPAVFLLNSTEHPDIGLAGATFGTTLFLVPIIGLLLTWWAARYAPRDYLAFALVGFSILYLDVSFFVISEIHVAVALFWPMLFLLLFSPRLTLIRSTALIAMAFLATRTYECYLLLALPLIWAALRRARNALKHRLYTELIICMVSVLLFLDGFLISIHATVFPRDPGMRTNFMISGLLHLVYPPVWFSLLTITGTLWCLFVPGRDRGLLWLCRITRVGGAIVAILPICGFVVPQLQYIARIQGLYVPFLLGMAVTLVTRSDLTTSSCLLTSRRRELWRFSAGACVVATAFQLFATVRWDGYRSSLLQDLNQHRGVIAFEDSAVGQQNIDRLLTANGLSELQTEFAGDPLGVIWRFQIEQFNWGWAMPTLCITLSALNTGSITTIVRAPASTGWQPFDPLQSQQIPDLGAYGIPADKIRSDGK